MELGEVIDKKLEEKIDKELEKKGMEEKRRH